MPTPLDDVCCANLPVEALPHLAALRARPDLRIHLEGGQAWAFWPAGEPEVTPALLGISGAELFARRGGSWYRSGQHLPAFDVPAADEARPIAHVLYPAPVQAAKAPERVAGPLRIALLREDRPRSATALRCGLAELGRWADTATSHHLAGLEAAVCAGRALLRGQRLPPLVGAERFWGRAVLVPLGFRPGPALPEDVLSAALGLAANEVALLSAEGAEVVPGSAFGPVSRAGVRLALRKGAP
jgi:hypothetical protein